MTLRAASSMNTWPPKPGWTVITRTMSHKGAAFSIAATGVSGFSVIPAVQPRS